MSSFVSRRITIISAVTLITFVVLYTAIFWAVPKFGLRYIEQEYAKLGDGYQLMIGDWGISPWNGHILLKDVNAQYPSKSTGEQVEVGLDKLALNVRLASLFNKEIHIQQASLHGLRFNGKQTSDELVLAGFPIPLASDDAPVSTDETASDDSSSPWIFLVDSVEFTDNTIYWKQDGLSVGVYLQSITLSQLNSASHAAVPVTIDLTVKEFNLTEPQAMSLEKPLTFTLDGNLYDVFTNPRLTANSVLNDLDVTGDALKSLVLSKLSLEGVDASYSEAGVVLSIKQLVLNNLVTELPEQGSAELGDFIVDDVQVDLANATAAVGNIKADNLNTADLGVTKAALKSLGMHSITAKNITTDPAVVITNITLTGASADLPEQGNVQLEDFSIDNVDVDLATAVASIEKIYAGNFTAADVAGGLESVTLASLGWENINVTELRTTPNITLQKFGITDLSAKHLTDGNMTLASLTVNGVSGGTEYQNIEQVDVKELNIYGANSAVPLLSLQEYHIPDIAVNQISLTTGLHTYAGLVATVTRAANGNIIGIPASAPATAPAGQSVDTEALTEEDVAPSQTFSVRIAGVKQVGDDDNLSQVHWTDESVTPVLTADLRIYELETGAVDTANLETAIPMTIVTGLDTYNRIVLKGALGLKNDLPEGELTFTIDQLNLPAFNPYVVQAMGYRVKKGMLKVDADITLHDGQLGGNTDILLKNSKLEPADDATINRISKQIAMPLDTALSVLRDDNNNIRLEVPLSGDITDPDVGINDVINQITTKALKTATVYYLKQSLQPYAGLITLASFASDQLFSIRLNDLNYDQFVTELNDNQKEYLDTVGRMMSKKTDLELQVCPVVSTDEAKQWGDGWVNYAQKRSAAVKAYLASVKDNKDNVLSSRISLCEPQKGDKPLVILGV
ncbi:DUF748 domain-containing protein [Thalassolituus sp.]|uniref:DUF748 domain-containing protein n=1 Tax=Thalassolituus sp. TaxID=2030822 RepID=UPI002A8241CF|nr:DUF748 domain-containing protein [Thalassolituus sp.]